MAARALQRTYAVNDVIEVAGNTFRVQKHLGSGGMGEVYVVKDRSLGSSCVLKLLQREAAKNDYIREGFLSEARVLSRINHKNVVRVVAANKTLAGEHYYLMEQLHGLSLADYAARRRATAIKMYAALDLGGQLLRGLRAIHELGVIHRDIKPQNLIIHLADGDQHLKIIDFGIMKLIADMTRERDFVGTPLYGAPEQIRCEHETGAVDVFAAGVVLFELLSGERPYPDVRRKSELVARTFAPAPSLASFGRFPPRLVALVDSMLSLEPGARPTAEAAMKAAEAIKGELPEYEAERMVTNAGILVDPSANQRMLTRGDLENATTPEDPNAPPAPLPPQLSHVRESDAASSVTGVLEGLSTPSSRHSRGPAVAPVEPDARAPSAAAPEDPDALDPTMTSKRTGFATRLPRAGEEPLPTGSATRLPRAGEQPLHTGPVTRSPHSPREGEHSPNATAPMHDIAASPIAPSVYVSGATRQGLGAGGGTVRLSPDARPAEIARGAYASPAGAPSGATYDSTPFEDEPQAPERKNRWLWRAYDIRLLGLSFLFGGILGGVVLRFVWVRWLMP